MKTPLDLLIGEDCMACNIIHLIFPYTKWRPTHYTKYDHNPYYINEWKDHIRPHIGKAKLFLWEAFQEGFPHGHPNYNTLRDGLGDIPNTTWFPRCTKHAYSPDNVKAVKKWHLPEICTCWDSASVMIQWMVLEGYDVIYLLGMDLGFVKDKTKNNFVPEYLSKDPQDKHELDNKCALASHVLAENSSPIPIYNATLGGELEVYPRVRLEDALNRN